MLAHRSANPLELLLDLAQPLDILGVRDELALVLVVRVTRELRLSAHVVLRGKLRFAGGLIGGAERRHAVLEGLALLLEGNALGLDLAVELRILRVRSGEVGGERVEALAKAVDLAL